MALSEGKEKKKRWSAIFVAVDDLLYMPNESSALSDGFVTSFLGRTEPTCSTFKPCKRSVPSPAIFSRAKRAYWNNRDIHAPLDWDWSPGNRRVSRLNVKALRTLVVVLRRSATAHAGHLCSTVKTTKRRSPLSPKNNRFAQPGSFFYTSSPLPSLFSLVFLLACVSSSLLGNRIHVVFASVSFAFVINKNDQKNECCNMCM